MLRLARLEPAARVRAIREVVSPTGGVVLVNVTLPAGSRSPLHWRTGTWDKPPLDVEIDPHDGRLQALQIVLQDESVPLIVKRVDASDSCEGLPVFDTSGWVSADRYRDETMAVAVNRAADDRLEAWLGGEQEPVSVLTVDDELALLFAGEGELVAIRVGPLTSHEWGVVAAAYSA